MSSVEAPRSYTTVSNPEKIPDSAYFIWRGDLSEHPTSTTNRCSSVTVVHLHKPGCKDKSPKPRMPLTRGSRLRSEYWDSCQTHVSHSWVANEDRPESKASGLHFDLANGTKETTGQVEDRLIRALCKGCGNCARDPRDLPVSKVYTMDLSE